MDSFRLHFFMRTPALGKSLKTQSEDSSRSINRGNQIIILALSAWHLTIAPTLYKLELTCMQRFFLAIAILSLGGCALPKKEYVPYDMVGPAICDTERQCQAMWLRATTEISTVSGMKVRLLTDTYIETFDGTVQGRMLGKVEKIPLQNGKGYMITPFLYCRPKCGDLPQRGQSLFNAAVKASGSGLGLNDGAKP